MDIFDSRYYRINKRLMESIGQWPYQPWKKRRMFFSLMYVSIGSVVLCQILKLNELREDVDELIECMIPMGVELVACLKSVNCLIKDVKMKKIVDMMKKDWAHLTDKDELAIMVSYAEKGFVLAGISGCALLFLVLPLSPQILDIFAPLNETRPKRFLYKAQYYVDPYEHYIPIMIHNYWASGLTILILVTVDAMLMAYVFHMCGIFAIVGHRMENSIKYLVNSDINDSRNNNVYRHISDCIKYHKDILEFGGLIEDSYSMTFLFQLALSMIMISATGLQIIAHIDDYNEVFRHVQFIGGQLFHLYVMNSTGQMLVDHTDNFRESVYFADWYRFPLDARHLLRLAMVRSLRPCKMTAGTVFAISIESFGKVLQTSMSWFTVLVSMR